MGFGGPVWHASIGIQIGSYSTQLLRDFALRALSGVGDEKLGQWEEIGRAFHVRRRLTAAEVAAGVGAVLDIRNTAEALARFRRMRPFLPPQITEPF